MSYHRCFGNINCFDCVRDYGGGYGGRGGRDRDRDRDDRGYGGYGRDRDRDRDYGRERYVFECMCHDVMFCHPVVVDVARVRQCVKMYLIWYVLSVFYIAHLQICVDWTRLD